MLIVHRQLTIAHYGTQPTVKACETFAFFIDKVYHIPLHHLPNSFQIMVREFLQPHLMDQDEADRNASARDILISQVSNLDFYKPDYCRL